MAYARRRGLRAPPSEGGMIDSMGELDLELDSSSPRGGPAQEEVFASNEGSEEDRHFDSIVGALEEAVMDPTFASLQQSFVDKWCGEFEDMEENKLIYTDLFRQYTQLVERHLDGWLRQRIRDFEMEAFMEMMGERKDEVVGDVVDILAAMGDFNEFKGMMIAHHEGCGNGLVVTSAPVVAAAAAAAAEAAGFSDPRNRLQSKNTWTSPYTETVASAQGTRVGKAGDYGKCRTSPRGAGCAGGASGTKAKEKKW